MSEGLARQGLWVFALSGLAAVTAAYIGAWWLTAVLLIGLGAMFWSAQKTAVEARRLIDELLHR